MTHLTSLTVENFRIIESASLNPSPGFNFVIGPNASGKSSLIEAIYFLGRARSYREARWQQVRREGSSYLRVTGKVGGDNPAPIHLGVERTDQHTLLRIEGRNAESAKALLQELPILLVQPESHRLIEQGPAHRRQFLDWGVFHVEHRFYPTWQRYRRAWRQRNAVLKDKSDASQLEPWEQEMDLLANELHRQRQRYIDQISPLILNLGQRLLGIDALSVRYHRGWHNEEDLGVVLRRSRESDRNFGYTRYGPHRADLSLYIGEQKAAARVSRGQQKLLVLSLVLAQAELLRTLEDRKVPALLVDDLAAELDKERVEKTLHHLQESGLQLFITGTGSELFPAHYLDNAAMFHVEHGEFTAVV